MWERNNLLKIYLKWLALIQEYSKDPSDTYFVQKHVISVTAESHLSHLYGTLGAWEWCLSYEILQLHLLHGWAVHLNLKASPLLPSLPSSSPSLFSSLSLFLLLLYSLLPLLYTLVHPLHSSVYFELMIPASVSKRLVLQTHIHCHPWPGFLFNILTNYLSSALIKQRGVQLFTFDIVTSMQAQFNSGV